MVSWREREARNEARFRTQNEWVETAGTAPGSSVAFVCECSDGECGRSLRLTNANISGDGLACLAQLPALDELMLESNPSGYSSGRSSQLS